MKSMLLGRCLLFAWVLLSAGCVLGSVNDSLDESSCKSDADCDHSEYCDQGVCRKLGR